MYQRTFWRDRAVDQTGQVIQHGTLQAVSSTHLDVYKRQLYDGINVKGRYRITKPASRCGKKPIGKNVTGWIDAKYVT